MTAVCTAGSSSGTLAVIGVLRCQYGLSKIKRKLIQYLQGRRSYHESDLLYTVCVKLTLIALPLIKQTIAAFEALYIAVPTVNQGLSMFKVMFSHEFLVSLWSKVVQYWQWNL